jgi:hypothetical protein
MNRGGYRGRSVNKDPLPGSAAINRKAMNSLNRQQPQRHGVSPSKVNNVRTS